MSMNWYEEEQEHYNENEFCQINGSQGQSQMMEDQFPTNSMVNESQSSSKRRYPSSTRNAACQRRSRISKKQKSHFDIPNTKSRFDYFESPQFFEQLFLEVSHYETEPKKVSRRFHQYKNTFPNLNNEEIIELVKQNFKAQKCKFQASGKDPKKQYEQIVKKHDITSQIEDKIIKAYFQFNGDIQQIRQWYNDTIGSKGLQYNPDQQLILLREIELILVVRIKSSIRRLEKIVKQKRLIKMYLPFNQLQLNETSHRFLQVHKCKVYSLDKALHLMSFTVIFGRQFIQGSKSIPQKQALNLYRFMVNVLSAVQSQGYKNRHKLNSKKIITQITQNRQTLMAQNRSTNNQNQFQNYQNQISNSNFNSLNFNSNSNVNLQPSTLLANYYQLHNNTCQPLSSQSQSNYNLNKSNNLNNGQVIDQWYYKMIEYYLQSGNWKQVIQKLLLFYGTKFQYFKWSILQRKIQSFLRVIYQIFITKLTQQNGLYQYKKQLPAQGRIKFIQITTWEVYQPLRFMLFYFYLHNNRIETYHLMQMIEYLIINKEMLCSNKKGVMGNNSVGQNRQQLKIEDINEKSQTIDMVNQQQQSNSTNNNINNKDEKLQQQQQQLQILMLIQQAQNNNNSSNNHINNKSIDSKQKQQKIHQKIIKQTQQSKQKLQKKTILLNQLKQDLQKHKHKPQFTLAQKLNQLKEQWNQLSIIKKEQQLNKKQPKVWRKIDGNYNFNVNMNGNVNLNTNDIGHSSQSMLMNNNSSYQNEDSSICSTNPLFNKNNIKSKYHQQQTNIPSFNQMNNLNCNNNLLNSYQINQNNNYHNIYQSQNTNNNKSKNIQNLIKSKLKSKQYNNQQHYNLGYKTTKGINQNNNSYRSFNNVNNLNNFSNYNNNNNKFNNNINNYPFQQYQVKRSPYGNHYDGKMMKLPNNNTFQINNHQIKRHNQFVITPTYSHTIWQKRFYNNNIFSNGNNLKMNLMRNSNQELKLSKAQSRFNNINKNPYFGIMNQLQQNNQYHHHHQNALSTINNSKINNNNNRPFIPNNSKPQLVNKSISQLKQPSNTNNTISEFTFVYNYFNHTKYSIPQHKSILLDKINSSKPLPISIVNESQQVYLMNGQKKSTQNNDDIDNNNKDYQIYQQQQQRQYDMNMMGQQQQYSEQQLNKNNNNNNNKNNNNDYQQQYQQQLNTDQEYNYLLGLEQQELLNQQQEVNNNHNQNDQNDLNDMNDLNTNLQHRQQQQQQQHQQQQQNQHHQTYIYNTNNNKYIQQQQSQYYKTQLQQQSVDQQQQYYYQEQQYNQNNNDIQQQYNLDQGQYYDQVNQYHQQQYQLQLQQQQKGYQQQQQQQQQQGYQFQHVDDNIYVENHNLHN